MRKAIGVMLLVGIPGILCAQEERQDLLQTIDRLCRLRNLDQVREHVYTPGSPYVVNGKVLKFGEFLDALEDGRSMGTAGIIQDTVNVELVSSGSLASAMFLTKVRTRLDDEEGKEVRFNLMTLWKVGATWKMVYWHQATSAGD